MRLGLKTAVFVSCTTVSKAPTPSTIRLKPDDLGVLKPLIQPVAAHWVTIADQLRMSSHVPTIKSTAGNTNPPECLRDLLHRWLNQGDPTLETLCQGLRSDTEIIGGAQVANILEEEFQNQT